jgi:hypothetical protein
MNANIIGIRIVEEADRLNVDATFQQSFADTVHTVHYATVTGKDDREDEITIENQARVANNFAAR